MTGSHWSSRRPNHLFWLLAGILSGQFLTLSRRGHSEGLECRLVNREPYLIASSSPNKIRKRVNVTSKVSATSMLHTTQNHKKTHQDTSRELIHCFKEGSDLHWSSWILGPTYSGTPLSTTLPKSSSGKANKRTQKYSLHVLLKGRNHKPTWSGQPVCSSVSSFWGIKQQSLFEVKWESLFKASSKILHLWPRIPELNHSLRLML